MAHVMTRRTKFVLDEDRIPRAWYNIAADLPAPPPPPLHPAPASRSARRSRAAVPDGADQAGGQPRARDRDPGAGPRRLRALAAVPALPGAPPREGARYAGAHLLQVRGRQPGRQPQAEHRRRRRRSTTRKRASRGSRPRPAPASGAARWRSPARCFGLEVKVYMVRASYDQKPYRRILMETYGAQVVASPVADTQVRPQGPRRRRRTAPGSLGIAISEAVEDAATREDTKYSLGSRAQPRAAAPDGHRPGGDQADGDGRRRAGRRHRLRRRRLELRRADLPVPRPEAARAAARPRIIAVEPEACPSLTRGVYAYDFGDTAKMTPLVKMHTLGHDFIPQPIHAGGLRYHGMAPLVSHAQGPRRHRGAQRPPDGRASRPASSSPGPRASCRRRSRPTRSASPSTRRSTPKARARSG